MHWLSTRVRCGLWVVGRSLLTADFLPEQRSRARTLDSCERVKLTTASRLRLFPIWKSRQSSRNPTMNVIMNLWALRIKTPRDYVIIKSTFCKFSQCIFCLITIIAMQCGNYLILLQLPIIKLRLRGDDNHRLSALLAVDFIAQLNNLSPITNAIRNCYKFAVLERLPSTWILFTQNCKVQSSCTPQYRNEWLNIAIRQGRVDECKCANDKCNLPFANLRKLIWRCGSDGVGMSLISPDRKSVV